MRIRMEKCFIPSPRCPQGLPTRPLSPSCLRAIGCDGVSRSRPRPAPRLFFRVIKRPCPRDRQTRPARSRPTMSPHPPWAANPRSRDACAGRRSSVIDDRSKLIILIYSRSPVIFREYTAIPGLRGVSSATRAEQAVVIGAEAEFAGMDILLLTDVGDHGQGRIGDTSCTLAHFPLPGGAGNGRVVLGSKITWRTNTQESDSGTTNGLR